MSTLKLTPRPSNARGHADHDWLKTFHTFDFASYQNSGHNQHGPLRVINEDRVAPHTGFGTHSHREFEIFSYIVSGELEHKDSMGNTEILKRGDLQLTSAGTGISHSEKAHGEQQVHFLQIWSVPSVSRLQPKYFTRHFSDEEKKDKFIQVVAPINAPSVSPTREGKGPTPVQSPLTLSAALISPSTTLSHTFTTSKGYIHVIQTSGYNPGKSSGATVRVKAVDGEEVVLREGDGVYADLSGGKEVEVVFGNEGDKVAEILVFDLD